MRIPRRLGFLAPLAAVVLQVACGGKASTPSSEESSVAEVDFPAAMAHAVCDGLDACCRLAGFADSIAECFDREFEAFATNAEAARLGGAKYDAAAAAACVAMSRERTSACLSSKQASLFVEPCLRAYQGGTVEIGGECTTLWACASPPDEMATCLAGACVGVDFPGDGDSCYVMALCEPGLFCRVNTCRPLVPLGEPCVWGADGDYCEAGATCDHLGTGRCVAAKAAGEPCTSKYECEEYSCLNGHCAVVAPATFAPITPHLCTD